MLPERLKIFLYRWFFSNLAGYSFGDWWRLLAENCWSVSPRFWPRAAFITLCTPLNSLQHRIEELRYGRQLNETAIQPPIFILGHWRGGTTHLQRLLALDERFVSPSMVETLFPHGLISGGPMGFFMGAFLPKNRVVDQVKLGIGEPFEDEFALLLLTRRSPYLGWTFPRRQREHEARLFLDDPQDAESWKRAFKRFIAKMTLKHGKPVLLKSPPHTARIRHLISLFPDARFVHIHRHPIEVFWSTCRLLEEGIDGLRLQWPPSASVYEEVIDRYARMYHRFFEETSLIPREQWAEVSYADLVAKPLDVLETIYRKLDLDEFAAVRPLVESHLHRQAVHQPRDYPPLDGEMAARLRQAWGPIVERWGYAIEG